MHNDTQIATFSLALALTACGTGASDSGDASDEAPGSSSATSTLPEPASTTGTTETTESPDTTTSSGPDLSTTTGPSGTSTTGAGLPAPAVLDLSFSQVKQFDFSWTAAAGADYYRLLKRREEDVDDTLLRDQLVGTSISLTMPLHLRWGTSYSVQACNSEGCTDSEPVKVVDSLADAVGYFKASNTGESNLFGYSVALSADGDVLAVGAPREESGAAGVGGDQNDDSLPSAGAVYVFVRVDGGWSQQAYIKASNPDEDDEFGYRVALSADGGILAVGAPDESGGAAGIDGDQSDDSMPGAGAVYVFVRDDDTWSQRAYIKASNPDQRDNFGESVALSADGGTLAVGAIMERSAAPGIDGDQNDESRFAAGAVYVFVRTDDAWSQQAYIKASNPLEYEHFGSSLALSSDGDTLAVGADSSGGFGLASGSEYIFARVDGGWSQQATLKASNHEDDDYFGHSVALSDDGDTLAVGAIQEDSEATGIDGDHTDNSVREAGAVYVFVRIDSTWFQQAYVKSSHSDTFDYFGSAIALSADGDVLAVGARGEDSAATGLNGNQADNSADQAGAVYVFMRDDDTWSQKAYLKASNTDPKAVHYAEPYYGISVALSGDGHTLAFGDAFEASAARGIGGDQTDRSASKAGAVYLY